MISDLQALQVWTGWMALIIDYRVDSKMNKLIITVLLAVMVLCQDAQPEPGHKLVGGFQRVEPNDVNSAEQVEEMRSAQAEARRAYHEGNNQSLGRLLEVHTQVVAGTNYRFTFLKNESSGETVDVVVFVQPWTNTVRTISINGDEVQ